MFGGDGDKDQPGKEFNKRNKFSMNKNASDRRTRQQLSNSPANNTLFGIRGLRNRTGLYSESNHNAHVLDQILQHDSRGRECARVLHETETSYANRGQSEEYNPEQQSDALLNKLEHIYMHDPPGTRMKNELLRLIGNAHRQDMTEIEMIDYLCQSIQNYLDLMEKNNRIQQEELSRRRRLHERSSHRSIETQIQEQRSQNDADAFNSVLNSPSYISKKKNSQVRFSDCPYEELPKTQYVGPPKSILKHCSHIPKECEPLSSKICNGVESNKPKEGDTKNENVKNIKITKNVKNIKNVKNVSLSAIKSIKNPNLVSKKLIFKNISNKPVKAPVKPIGSQIKKKLIRPIKLVKPSLKFAQKNIEKQPLTEDDIPCCSAKRVVNPFKRLPSGPKS